MPARCLCGIAEAEPITVRNCEPGSHCRAVADGDIVTRDDHDAYRNVLAGTVRATRHHRALCTEQHGVRLAGFNQRDRTG